MELLKAPGPPRQLTQQSDSFPVYTPPLSVGKNSEDAVSDAGNVPEQNLPSASVPDLSPDEEEQLLKSFRTEKLPWMPVMHVPETTRPADLKRESPLVWLCIMAIQSRCTPHTRILCDRVRKEAGRRMMVDCEKSLDLLQGALMYLGW